MLIIYSKKLLGKYNIKQLIKGYYSLRKIATLQTNIITYSLEKINVINSYSYLKK